MSKLSNKKIAENSKSGDIDFTNSDSQNLAEISSDQAQVSATSVGKSAALISVCVLISRITGFGRTWIMAFALGQSVLSGAYAVANNLPNLLFELVAGGLLVTAFLPVYLSVKNKLGQKQANAYASNIFTLLVIALGITSVICMAFPSAIITTQNFLTDLDNSPHAVLLFQFFAIQIVFYGISALLSGLLDANRDYLWSAIAPVANNVILISTFLIYAVVAPNNPTAALYVIAIGNPLGVFAQMALQWPALKKHGIRLNFRIDLKDPALRETISLGIPTFIVMIATFAIVSVQTAAANAFLPWEGASVIAYSRLWFTLPYAFLAVPITTTLFTEISHLYSAENKAGIAKAVQSGTTQIIFFMVPFSLYLMVFAEPLITLYVAGEFSEESVDLISSFLAVLSASLVFYALNTYLQKIFSAIREMKLFAVVNIVAALVQIALTVAASLAHSAGLSFIPMESIAICSLVFYVIADVYLYLHLRKNYPGIRLSAMLLCFVKSLAIGAIGAGVGFGALYLLNTYIASYGGSIGLAFAYTVVAGLLSLVATYGIAIKTKMPESEFISSLLNKVRSRF